MKRFTKMLCMLLALVMVVGMLPLSILADGAQTAHTVKFNLNYNGAHQIPAQTVEHGQCATQPENVTREGWIFQYWYVKTGDGIQKFDLTQPVTEDMTLYARWDEDINYWGPIWSRNLQAAADAGKAHGNTYTVTFDPNGTDVTGMPAAQRVKEGGYATEPAEPSRAGYLFGGWYKDKECTEEFDFLTKIQRNYTLYAQWTLSIYSNELDESHIKTGTLKCDGESYTGNYIDNELIVFFKEGTSREKVAKIVDAYGGSIVGQVPLASSYEILFPESDSIEDLNALSAALSTNSAVDEIFINEVLYLTENAYYTNDLRGHPVNTPPVNEIYRWKDFLNGHLVCKVPDAWEMVLCVNKNPSINLGFIDTAFDATHEDLNLVNVYYRGNCNPYTIAKNNPEAAEHGTHVAGIMGAITDNGYGVAGIALNASLNGVSVISSIIGKKSIPAAMFAIAKDIPTLIECGTQSGTKPTAINMSLGSISRTKDLAVKNAARVTVKQITPYHDSGYRFVLVAAAGNNALDKKGNDNSNDDTNYNSFLANINEEYLRDQIIVVGNAYTPRSGEIKRAPSSSYRGGRVDVMAPGVLIYSTLPNNQYGKTSLDGSEMSGTSMAAPFVTGLAGLLWEANPTLTAEEIKSIIVSTANISVEDSDAKLINAEAAVIKVIGYDPRKTDPDPTPAETKTMRIRFVDSDTKKVVKISDMIPDNFALLAIGHTSLENIYFLSSYINPPKGFTIENGTDFVFPEIPVITAPGNYIFKIKYNSDTYFLPGNYGDYTIDTFKTSPSAMEWSIDVPVTQKKLIVGDVRVTPDNAADILGDGTAKYDFTTNTLTLTNAKITAYDVIYAELDSLHVVIPENTTTVLHNLLEHDDWGDVDGDVISQVGGLYISGGGTLSMRGSKGVTEFGRDVTTRYCAFADYIRMDNITIEMDEYIGGGFYCEPGDIELKNTHITFSSLKYSLLFSCGDITISDSVINCLSGEYLSIHAHYKTFITNSTLTLNALTPHIDCDDLSVYNSVVHIKNAKEIHMEGRSAITLTGVKIVTPANGIIYNNGETYYIANPDGSYPTEILIR